MNLSEAKQLKAGDRIIVEMVVGSNDEYRIIDADGDVWLTDRYVHHERIREKLEPPRRKFRKGDIVSAVDGEPSGFFELDEDEEAGEIKVFINGEAEFWDAAEAQLVCDAKNREDL